MEEKEKESERRTKWGSERKKMRKQTLALGIDAISSVSQLMTNSIEKREEQKKRSNSVGKSKREKHRGWVKKKDEKRRRTGRREIDAYMTN